MIQAPQAWDITTGSSNVVVAVIDTGIDYTHPDLTDNISTNPGEIRGNGVDDDGNGFVDDYYGYDFINGDSDPMDDHFHGSHCAGTIGGRGDNGRGVAGVNWTVKLMPVKVLDSYGSGTLAAVAAGMNYAVKRGVKIMSMSLGTTGYSATLENAIINAKNAGVLVVAAAGNSSQNTDISPNYPSASAQDNVIAVAASNSTDTLAYFSNWGPSGSRRKHLEHLSRWSVRLRERHIDGDASRSRHGCHAPRSQSNSYLRTNKINPYRYGRSSFVDDGQDGCRWTS